MSTPIKHVVIIVKENHTFDNYFGTFPGAAGVPLPQAPDPIVNDPPHRHGAWLTAQAHQGGLKEQYGKKDIPAYWAYAQNYVLCDNYFTDVASQSEPNHLHLIAADSPVIDNATASRTYQPSPPYALSNLPATLESAGLQWRNYADSNASYFDHIVGLQGHRWSVAAAQFDKDAAAGALPDVAWLYAPGGFSEHPGDLNHTGLPIVARGMQWTVDRVKSIAASSAWPNTVIFITWDDWGGWYDHVAPPLASKWSGGGPAGYNNSQFRYGNRVPCLAVSPYAKVGLNHVFYSHASVVKFCLRLFSLKSWNARALQAGDKSGDMWECFDFLAPPRLAPPSTTPA